MMSSVNQPEQKCTLKGKVAIITGAGHGLGRSHALQFAREGAKAIVINDLGVGVQEKNVASADSAEETVEMVKDLGCDAVAVFGDCAVMDVGKQLVDTALSRWGRLDILVNNAANVRDQMIFNMSEEAWDRVVRVNLKGSFTATRFATEYWRNQFKAGEAVSGRIINTSSAAGLFGNAGQPNYSAAKAGIIGFTLSLAFSMARYGVTANVIAPGAKTDVTLKVDGASEALIDAMRVEQVSPLVAFIASDLSAHITGRVFHVAGGRIDHVNPHVLVKGAIKRGAPWTVDEIANVFAEGFPGSNPESLQDVFDELTEDLVRGI